MVLVEEYLLLVEFFCRLQRRAIRRARNHLERIREFNVLFLGSCYSTAFFGATYGSGFHYAEFIEVQSRDERVHVLEIRLILIPN